MKDNNSQGLYFLIYYVFLLFTLEDKSYSYARILQDLLSSEFLGMWKGTAKTWLLGTSYPTG